MKVMLDTSFLLAAMEGKIDIVSELQKFDRPELYVLDLVMKELKSFSAGRSRKAFFSRLSLDFIQKSGTEIVKTVRGQTDRRIVSYAINHEMWVCTMDAAMKKMLRKRGVPVITIRQGRYLVNIHQLSQARG